MSRNNYISIILSVVLLAPMVYQYIHVAEYHSGPECAGHCDMSKHADIPHQQQSACHEDGAEPVQSQSSGKDSPQEGSCPVLDFEYFANDLPQPTPVITGFSQPIVYHIPLSVTTGFTTSIQLTSPRGPPVKHC